MTESPTSYARFAGLARFPRRPLDLTSTDQCPACFETLDAVICTTCGLDLTGSTAAELAGVSESAAALLDTRVELIGRIRFETAAAARADATAAEPATVSVAVPLFAGSAPSRLPVDSSAPVPPTTAAGVSASAPAVAQVSPASTRPVAAPGTVGTGADPRRSSVQVALLVVGVSLVSIAAVFFLVYAFINYGIVWRSVIIGAVTVAAFVIASVLRRKGLGSTAEGIAAFAVVLVFLDAFAVRANDLFGAQATDALGYWGVTLAVAAVGFAVWHRASSLRVANIAAFVVFAPGVGLIAAALAGPLEPAARVWAAFLAVGLAGLVHPLAKAGARGASAAAERVIAVGFALVALPVSFILAFAVAPDDVVAAPLALLAVGAVAVAHTIALLRARAADTVARVAATTFAVTAALGATIAVALCGYRVLPLEFAIAVSPAAVTTLAFAIALLASRATAPLSRLGARGASIAASSVAVATLAPAFVGAAFAAALPPLTGLVTAPWQGDIPGAPSRPDAAHVGAVVALALAALIGWLFQAATGLFPRIRAALPGALYLVLLFAVPLLAHPAAIVAAWMLLAALAVATLVVARHLALPLARRPVATLGVVAAAFGYAASWGSTETWLPASVAMIALLVAARSAVAAEDRELRSGLLGAGVLVAVVGAAALGRQLGVASPALLDDGNAPLFDSLRAVSILAIALLALAAVPAGRYLSTLDRRTVFFIAAPLAAGVIPFAGAMLVLDRDLVSALVEPVTSMLLATALLATLGGWLIPRANGGFAAERVVASIAMAPAVFWALDSLALVLRVQTEVTQLAAVVSALLVAAGSLLLVVRRPLRSRDAADIGTGLVGTAGTVVAVMAGSPLAWLALLLAAATLLLLATSRDGLIGSRSPRRHWAWAALALATAGLWWRLQLSSVTVVEAYTLPIAGVLLLVAALVWRSARSRGLADASAPVITLAALLVAVVPSALSASSASDSAASGVGGATAIAVFAAAVALLLGGSLTRTDAAARSFLDAGAAAGLVGVVVVAVGRLVRLADLQPDLALDAWAGAVFTVLVIAAIGQCVPRAGDRPVTPAVARAVVIGAMLLVLAAEGAASDSSPIGSARAVAVVVLFSAVHVASLAARPPFDAPVGVVAVALAGVAGVVAVGVGAVDAVEWVSVPIAAALLVTGATRLSRTPRLRSWPALAPGLAVLLVPSLLATMVDRPVWRLVAIGVVAIAVFVFGFVRRLQALFLIGGAVALVHGIATFSPQLRDVYQLTEWWVWAGAGGIVIIVLGARYERSLRSARSIVVGIGALR
ncbi:hypothetical protein ABIE21_001281 [Conyzicola nivalis]|uniref:DUF2157 domain-containing protein n=1 Tax=Conyzicola nivalis TaxID=1477021 RepID=A0ABV2QL90_9MICO